MESELRAALDAAGTALDGPARAAEQAALAGRLEALSGEVTNASGTGGRIPERQTATLAWQSV